MELKEEYTIDEIAELFDCSERTIRRNIKKITDTLSTSERNKKVSVNIVSEIAKLNNWEFQKEFNGHRVVEEFFTENEYSEFEKRLREYPYLKERIETLLNDLDYHKKASESHQRQMEMILNIFNQRNILEGVNYHNALIKDVDKNE